MKVSEGTLERAVQVMGQIVAVLEGQGFTVEVSEGHTFALINGERVCFGIEEPVRKVVMQKPRVANPTDRWDYDEEVKYEPAGKFTLLIHASTWGKYEQRSRWSDAKIQRIESIIGDFVAGLMRTGVALRRSVGGREATRTRTAEARRRSYTASQGHSGRREETRAVQQVG